MKKFMLIIGIVISIFTASASESQTRAEVYRLNHESIKDGRERIPFHLPVINIIYNSDDHSIECISSIDCDVYILVFDIYGNLICSADSLDEKLYLPNVAESKYNIRIESDNWYAKASIKV